MRYHPCGNLVRRVVSIIAIQPLHAARSEHALHRVRRRGARATRNENRARQPLDALYGFPRQFPALGLSLLKENRNAITICKAADRQRILEVRSHGYDSVTVFIAAVFLNKVGARDRGIRCLIAIREEFVTSKGVSVTYFE